MEELYWIPNLAARPALAIVGPLAIVCVRSSDSRDQELLQTGSMTIWKAVERLEAEEQRRREMKERERLADKAAREEVLRKIENNRRRVKSYHSKPRFTAHEGPLGSTQK
jgi:hypothetical protein